MTNPLTNHRAHPVGTDAEEALLWDNCDRCDEQAKNLTEIDPPTLYMLWWRMENWVDHRPLNTAEAIAMRHLEKIKAINAIILTGAKEVGGVLTVRANALAKRRDSEEIPHQG